MKLHFKNISELYHRLDSSILFTLVRLGYEAMLRVFSNQEIILLAVYLLVAVTTMQSFRLVSKSSTTLQVNLTIGSAILSQAVVQSVTQITSIFRDNHVFGNQSLIDIVVVTAVLFFVGSTPSHIQQLPFVSRAVTLVLYMYTDALGILLHDVTANQITTATAILIYVVLICYTDRLHKMPVLLYCIKALSMLSVNTILTNVSSHKHSQFDNATQAVVIVIVLFGIDALCSLTDKLDEAKGFAIWKCAQLLFIIYSHQHIAADITFFLAVLVFSSSVMALLPQTTLVQLLLLISINVLLDSFTSSLNKNTGSDLFVLFIAVLILHIIPQLLHST